MTQLPLARFKVLDLTAHRAGPTAVRQLADWGADVIKIERPASGDADSMGGKRARPDFQNLHRNKRSLTLDLKSDEGRGIFLRAGRRRRRRRRELPLRRQDPARRRLRSGLGDQSAHRLRQHFRFRPDGPDATRPASTRSRRAWAA